MEGMPLLLLGISNFCPESMKIPKKPKFLLWFMSVARQPFMV
jgi:hypothetical protein